MKKSTLKSFVRSLTDTPNRYILIEVSYAEKLPDRLGYKHLVEEVIPERMVAAENPTGMGLVLDGCTGGCPDCFQKDYCDSARENWPELFTD